MTDSKDLIRYSDSSGTSWDGRSERAIASDDPLTGASGAPSEPHVEHELFAELRAASPRWQYDWKTLRDAAVAYGLVELYYDFVETPQGARYIINVQRVPDYGAENERRRAERAAEVAMASQAKGLSPRSIE
jgi:hypothetical protein